jgi:DNA invertase Pin-like site-specific DNA recombinase
VERKRNRRRGQGVENIAEKQEMADNNAIFSPVSLDLFGRFRLVRSCRKTNFQNQKKENVHMKKAVIYARYSCDNQTEQPIEGQLRVCRDYAERNNILIIDTYVDRAMTGTNDLRPDFQRMMKDSSKKQWNYVLVYKLDRFSRDKHETTIHKHTLKMNGVKVLSAMENIPDSPEGIILESLLEGMNQYYSAELSQKVKRGMYETRRKGHYQGGWLPYAYRIEGRNIVADEEQAEVVRYMFEQYSMGTYVSTIISNLTARGILNKGKPFVPNTVYNILKNEKYSGVYRRGEEVIDNMYPQIVPQQLFDAVRQKVTKNRFGKRSVKVVYLFRDKMICGYCGSPVSAETGTARGGDIVRYYKCHGKKRYHNECELKMIRKDVLEECIVDKIIQELSRPHNMDSLVADLLQEQDRQCVENSRLSSLRREKATVDRSLDNLIAALEQGIMSASTNKRLHELEKQQTELERDIALEESKTTVKIPESVIREFYADALKQETVLLVNLLIHQIVLYNDRIEIYLHIPTKNGPDNHRCHSFFMGQVNLSFTAYQRNPSDVSSVQIEIFV